MIKSTPTTSKYHLAGNYAGEKRRRRGEDDKANEKRWENEVKGKK